MYLMILLLVIEENKVEEKKIEVKKTEVEKTELETTTRNKIDSTSIKPPTSSAPSKISTSFLNNSKFKHLFGEPMHKKNNIENLKNLSESLPSESEGIQCNKDFVVVPLTGAGGQLAVFQVMILNYR